MLLRIMTCVLCKKEPQVVDACGHFEEDVANGFFEAAWPLFTLWAADATPLRTDVAAGLRI